MDCLKCEEEKKPVEDRHCWHDIEERFGLERIESFDDPEASYYFDEFRIWRRISDGKLFYGKDSGCSCPSPYENFKQESDLSAITHASWATFVSEFSEYCGQRQGYKDDGPRWVEAHIEDDTVKKVRGLLDGKAAV